MSGNNGRDTGKRRGSGRWRRGRRQEEEEEEEETEEKEGEKETVLMTEDI